MFSAGRYVSLTKKAAISNRPQAIKIKSAIENDMERKTTQQWINLPKIWNPVPNARVKARNVDAKMKFLPWAVSRASWVLRR